MPTKRRCFSRFAQPTLSAGLWALLNDAEPPAEGNPFELLALRDAGLRELWHEHREQVLADFIDQWPGCRPALWWQYDAPADMRRQLAGSGAPLHTVSAFVRYASYGLLDWACADPDELVFETQAAYLRRHGLLLPAERRARPVEPHPLPARIEKWVSGGLDNL
jgi:hypothetical protein